tara:strand:+ start:710 stop:1276 length:567 start_codon:yes stop_codon:yes gene_type:complete
MDISRVISIVRTLKEQPENSTGSTAGTNPTAGFSQNSNAAGPVAGIDKRLFPAAIDDLSQDYQSPGQTGLAVWRFSNVYPVQKLGDGGVDSMVDASKEYMQMSDNSNSSNLSSSRLDAIIDMIRGLKEEMTTGSTPGSAGFSNKAPAEGPTAGFDKLMGNYKKKKRPTILAKGLMPGARKRWTKKDGK